MELFIKIMELLLPALSGGFVGFMAAFVMQKRNENERFFFEIYPKRLELYRRIFVTANQCISDVARMNNETPVDFNKQLHSRLFEEFFNLQVDALLFGSREILESISVVLKKLYVIKEKVAVPNSCEGATVIQNFFNELLPDMQTLTKLVELESAPDFITKYIKRYNNKNDKKQKPR